MQPNGVHILPLGGLGHHIGGNAMVYETEADLILVDCGLLFPSEEQPGIDYVIPDLSYVRERRDKLRAIIITHGHEDHIGALPYVLPSLRAPVFASEFTSHLLAAKLGAWPELATDLRRLRDRELLELGDFRVDPLSVTHSIPGAVALAIHTPCGTLVHTGDFKLDAAPPDGRNTDLEALGALGDEGIVALLSDSTNAEVEGHTPGEDVVAQTLDELIATAPFRVVITAFASNIDRLQAVITSSQRLGRKVVLAGRAVQQNVQVALENGYLEAKPSTLVAPEEIGRVPRQRTTVIAGGSQGEPHSTMSRIASGGHGLIKLEPGDRAIISARRIPGNERAVGTVINNLYRLGVEVFDDHHRNVHASGHAFNEEQREMIRACRPRFFVPIHGEYRQLARHAALARAEGVSAEHTFVLEDGQPLELWPSVAGVQARRGEPVQTGYVFVDGKGVGDVGEVVLRDRRMLAETGVVTCVLIVTEQGATVAGPHLTSRGLIHEDHSDELLARARTEVVAALAALPPRTDNATRAEEMRVSLRRFFRRELDRRPLVVPVVVAV